MIAQRLLCRWWYAIDWPRIQDIGTPPPGYEALEGFLGVFASTRVCAEFTIINLILFYFILFFSLLVDCLYYFIN